ncbi:MAG: hypothetical protein ACJ8BF_11685 [Gemmatimonadales bacterium]
MSRLCILAGLLLAGCYTYRPLENPAPPPGQRVSAQLTSEGSRDLTPEIGPEILHIEGDVVTADSTVLDLEVREIESYRGIRTDWHGEHVKLPRQAVAGLQQRRLSIGGTTLLGGVLAGGMYVVYRVLGGPGLFEGGNGQVGGHGN